jgi:hypothetical protein
MCCAQSTPDRSRRKRARLSALISALGVTVCGPSAHAYCREVSATTPSGYDPAAMGCFYPTVDPKNDAGVFQLYWKNRCVGYSLQKDASKQVTLDEARQVAAQAFAAWGAVTCPGGGSPSISAQEMDPVSCSLVQSNDQQGNHNAIIFRDEGWPYTDSSNTLGLTSLFVDLDNGEILDADMELNSHDYQFVVGSPVTANSYDLRSVMTHEAGHFLGLAHSQDTSAVMFVHYKNVSTTPTPDDVNGLCAIYPPDGTRATNAGSMAAGACNATPPNGFSGECGPIEAGGPIQYFDAGAGGTQVDAVDATTTVLPLCDTSVSCNLTRGRTRKGLGLALLGLTLLGAAYRRGARSHGH